MVGTCFHVHRSGCISCPDFFPGIRLVLCYSCDVTDFIIRSFDRSLLIKLRVVFYLNPGFLTHLLNSSVLLTSDLPHGGFKKKEKHCLLSLEINDLAWVVSIWVVPQTLTPCLKSYFPFGLKPSSSDPCTLWRCLFLLLFVNSQIEESKFFYFYFLLLGPLAWCTLDQQWI